MTAGLVHTMKPAPCGMTSGAPQDVEDCRFGQRGLLHCYDRGHHGRRGGDKPASRNGLELSVVMPVYNEADAVGPVVSAWAGELDRLTISYEFLVYDDGSRNRDRLMSCAKSRTSGARSSSRATRTWGTGRQSRGAIGRRPETGSSRSTAMTR